MGSPCTDWNDRLRKLRAKFRREATRERKMEERVQSPFSKERSRGMWIAYEACANEINRLIVK